MRRLFLDCPGEPARFDIEAGPTTTTEGGLPDAGNGPAE